MVRTSFGKCLGTVLAYALASVATAQMPDGYMPFPTNRWPQAKATVRGSQEIIRVNDEGHKHDDGHQHDHDDGHQHDHDDHHEHHDKIEPYDHNHEHVTSAGTPIFEALRTDHAFLERKLRLDYLGIRGFEREAGTVADLDLLNAELFWQLNSRMAVVVSGPVIYRNARSFSSDADFDSAEVREGKGIGDLEIGYRFLAFNGERSLLTFGLNVTTSSGAASKGLGEGHTSVEPVTLFWHDLGHGTVLQTELSFEVPVGVHEVESQFRYNVALMHTLPASGSWQWFRWLTPLIELNGRSDLNGDHPGHTVIELTPGVRWAISEKDHAGFGMSLPITGTREFDSLFIFSFIHHF